jgi:hypothetical protein
MLSARDRFLIDLLTTSGIRVGEALSLFVADLHFGGGSQQLGCPHADPHFHVRVDNPVENSAGAKGGPRTLFVHRDIVESYIDYALERRKILEARGVCDASPHVFVNLYSEDRWLGRSMTYSSVKRLLNRCSNRIGFALSGPHILRHTFATRLIRGIDCDPIPLDVVQALLGHAALSSTRVYTHDTEAAMKAATIAIAARPAPGAGGPLMPASSLSLALLSQPATPALTWRDQLLEAIDPNWRPGEYDHGQLLFVPSSDNPRTQWRLCRRAGCENPSHRSRLCRVCSAEYRAADSVSFEQFCATQRTPQPETKRPKGCLVGCHRTVTPNGLCAQHSQSFNSFISRHGATITIAAWIEYAHPKPLPPLPLCVVPNCPDDRFYGTGLCSNHQRGAYSWIRLWTRRGLHPTPDVDMWLERRAEPLDPQTGQPMSALGAVPFGLMKGTGGLELLLALQLRDKDGGADLDPQYARQIYLAVRRLGLETLIGFKGLNSVDVARTAKRRAFVADCMRWIMPSTADGRAPMLVIHCSSTSPSWI